MALLAGPSECTMSKTRDKINKERKYEFVNKNIKWILLCSITDSILYFPNRPLVNFLYLRERISFTFQSIHTLFIGYLGFLSNS
jgi:hypothetical protein